MLNSACRILLTSGLSSFPNLKENGKQYMGLAIALLHPFSRGDVHLSSSDPLAAPTINPNTFDNEVDLDLLVGGIKLARKIVAAGPLCPVVVNEVAPGTAVRTAEELKSFVRNDATTLFHPVGTASMLPAEDGGVVDAHLKSMAPRTFVWLVFLCPAFEWTGCSFIAQADASIIPIELGPHTQASVYGIAEKVALLSWSD